MTVNKLMTTVDSMYPNTFNAQDKLDWLNQIEHTFFLEVVSNRENPDEIVFDAYTDAAEEKTLIIPDPYAEMYIKYLLSQIDQYNGDFARYNNTSMLFNMAYQTACDYWSRTHGPAQTKSFVF